MSLNLVDRADDLADDINGIGDHVSVLAHPFAGTI